VPEGDTVYRQAGVLRAALEGRVLAATDFRVPKYAVADLSGETVSAVLSRGKHLLIRAGGYTIHSHLKMEGTWHVYGRGADGSFERWRKPAHTARCVLSTASHSAVGFSLGLLELRPTTDEEDMVGYLGPDLLGPDWDAGRALERLSAAPGRAIGVALLDQRNLAGVGNVFRSDICFLAGVHPATPVGDVGNLPKIVALSKTLLEANKDRSRRSTTGGPAVGDAATWVYGREHRACKRCRTRIVRTDLGEAAGRDAPGAAERIIYFCPHCQPAPA